MKKPDKIRLGTRGPYVVAVMPEGVGRFVVEELVAELRRTRRRATVTAIADEYGESERNFRRYLRGGPMPLGKGRRFARRLQDLHFALVAALERIAQAHPRGQEATELLRKTRDAFEEGYPALGSALNEQEDIVGSERAALVLKRTQADAQMLAQESNGTRSRHERLKLQLANSLNVLVREWPPPCELGGFWVCRDCLLSAEAV